MISPETDIRNAFNALADPAPFRKDAFDRFSSSGMPHRRMEGWHWSDFRKALREDSAAAAALAQERTATGSPALPAIAGTLELCIRDGRIILPDPARAGGIVCETTASGPAGNAYDNHPVVSLNVAMAPRTLLLRVPEGARIERPVHIRHVNNTEGSVFSQVRGHVHPGAQVTIIETFEGTSAYDSSFCHLDIGDGAQVERYLLHAGTDYGVIHHFFAARTGRHARLKQTALSDGSKMARFETHIRFARESARCDLASVALVSGRRHADFTSFAGHDAPSCTVRQIHKGVARGHASTVFQGKFHVSRKGQHTDARMHANALLLSDTAQANHKPELEIYADDVECAHGATSGTLDQDALFYLRQRGLDIRAARKILTEAFVLSVTGRIDSDAVRPVFQEKTARWLEEA